MKVAIVGSRDFRNSTAVRDYVANLPPDTIVISGGADGVDTWARQSAFRYNLICIEVLPAWGKGKQAGFERNSVIVELADRVVAFWDGKSRGTQDTMAKTRAAGKPLEIIRPE